MKTDNARKPDLAESSINQCIFVAIDAKGNQQDVTMVHHQRIVVVPSSNSARQRTPEDIELDISRHAFFAPQRFQIYD